MQVSLFTTCLTDTFFSEAARAAVRLLQKLGCEVDLPSGQTCCGQVQFNNGLHDQARSLARNLIDTFAASDCVVCPSASCSAMIRDYYLQLFAEEAAYHDRVREFIDKTYEFTEFISKILKADLKVLSPRGCGRVTYHYSCHNRGVELGPEVTIDLIKLIEGVEYVRLEKMDQCCGFGGTFSVKMGAISEALVADKAGCIQATGADTVVVNEGGCTLNIAGYCHRQGLNIRFIHIAQLLAESLGLMSQQA